MALWGALWIQKGSSDGDHEHLIHRNLMPVMFKTRREARVFIQKEYWYYKTRKDLRAFPHCWRMPKPVKLTVNYMR